MRQRQVLQRIFGEGGTVQLEGGGGGGMRRRLEKKEERTLKSSIALPKSFWRQSVRKVETICKKDLGKKSKKRLGEEGDACTNSSFVKGRLKRKNAYFHAYVLN